MRSSPSQLQRVCVGPDPPTSPQHQGGVNISWEPLPCHLQNGANVARYVIQYTNLSTGVSTNISIASSVGRIECHQEPGGPYSCVVCVRASLFIPGVTYSFQVAAENMNGVGSFSNSVTTLYGSNGKHNKLAS